ncbi:MAG: Hsp70 family protein, partial [Syntrophomonadaceae bacterium]|nr:Hsp70 family protein [Syntrophomonadaceae bacterium]
GIVNVSAKDLATNKEQKITITSSSGLSEEDIERMIKDAEAFAEEDEKRVKEIEIRNNADSMIYQADKTLKEYADKIDDESKNNIESAKEELKSALEGSNMDEITEKTQKLAEAIYGFTAKMYENANPNTESDDNVFDADYDIPNDEDK